MGRHNNLSRVGVHKIAQIFEEDFEWVFREQFQSDVGIDALVELCSDSNPQGRFLSVQIKSGDSNVYWNRDGSFTYYITNVHFEYWSKLDIPIILVFYLKKPKKRVYWVEFKESKVSRTKARYKIQIPHVNILNINSKDKIRSIILKGRNKSLLSKKSNYNTPYKNITKTTVIEFIPNSLDELSKIIRFLGSESNKVKVEIEKIPSSDDLNQKEDLRQLAISKIEYILMISASRIYNETIIISRLFADLYLAHSTRFTILKTENNQDFQQMVKTDKENLATLISNFEYSVSELKQLKKATNVYRGLLPKESGEFIDQIDQALDQTIEEFTYSSLMIESIVE